MSCVLAAMGAPDMAESDGRSEAALRDCDLFLVTRDALNLAWLHCNESLYCGRMVRRVPHAEWPGQVLVLSGVCQKGVGLLSVKLSLCAHAGGKHFGARANTAAKATIS